MFFVVKNAKGVWIWVAEILVLGFVIPPENSSRALDADWKIRAVLLFNGRVRVTCG